MAFNFQQMAMLQRGKVLLEKFRTEHPKFPLFLNAVQQDGIKVGSVLEISVTSPEGKNYTTNIRITDNDMELLEMVRNLRSSQ